MSDQHLIPQEQWEEIERFLLHEMTSDEEERFRERMLLDSDLKKATEEMKLLSIGVQEAYLENKLDHFHKEIIPNSAEKKRNGKLLSIRRWLVAASIVFVLIISGYFFFGRKNKNAELYAEFFKPDPGLVSAMGSSPNYQFERGMIDYKTGNYEAAIKTWEGLLVAKPNSDTLNYFLGSAYLANKKTDEAISFFEKITALPAGSFTSDAYWYLGLSYLKQGKTNKAVEYIQKSGNPQREAILKTINKK
jgi:tetratricopeptide (TPR) repeat protein